jgi:hypothetical protein
MPLFTLGLALMLRVYTPLSTVTLLDIIGGVKSRLPTHCCLTEVLDIQPFGGLSVKARHRVHQAPRVSYSRAHSRCRSNFSPNLAVQKPLTFAQSPRLRNYVNLEYMGYAAEESPPRASRRATNAAARMKQLTKELRGSPHAPVQSS